MIISRRYSKDRIFASSVLNWLELFFVFVCPVERRRVLDQVVEGLTVHLEVLDIATIQSKASKNFHDVSLIFGWFEVFQVFYSFCNGLDSFWRYNVTKKLNFFKKTERFVRSCLETCLPKKGMVLVDDREDLVLNLWLHYGIVIASDCLLLLDD